MVERQLQEKNVGMLAAESDWNLERSHQVPAELAATARYANTSLLVEVEEILTSKEVLLLTPTGASHSLKRAKRFCGDNSIPVIEVDSHMVERVGLILAESEKANDRWLYAKVELEARPIVIGGPLGPRDPVERDDSCPSSLDAGSTAESLKNSRAVRLARFSKRTRVQSVEAE